jgi:Family of unknown function (DUF6356)
MKIRTLLTDHPRSVGESYPEHMRIALSFAGPLGKAAGAALVHALLPFLFVRTASVTVKVLHDRMTHRCAACPKVALHRPDLFLPRHRAPSGSTMTGASTPDYVI